MNKDFSFVFKGYDSRLENGEIIFNFGLVGDENVSFSEKISFPPVQSKIPESLLKSLLDNFMLILGISYWKLYCPKKIVIENNFLTKKQAQFWNIVYTKGLGEFFYKNKIDFRRLISFPFAEQNLESLISFPRKNRSLLGVGGGKDSIVAAEILKKENKDFDALISIPNIQKEVSLVIGKTPIVIKRELDPKLFELNKESGIYNGHIPISVIYAFMGLMGCIFYNYENFVVGNEKSANFGNVEYLGEMINHQWSKSEEFEKLFNEYVHEFITPNINYFSPLRKMTELQVVEEFVKYPKYFRIFSSCNKNFKINNPNNQRWCGKCPKCLFVFICLAVFLSKDEVINIFGKNLLDDKNLLLLFEELVGIRNFKPFECVGTPEETREALEKIINKKEFDESFLIKHYEAIRIK